MAQDDEAAQRHDDTDQLILVLIDEIRGLREDVRALPAQIRPKNYPLLRRINN
ncbi:hypothetical protein [Kineosporia babensis]|uniref:Uncharacterized protein n=1 Tax=Kineosporia babensis TaxID=499548 RepID=A0A9X1NBW2_9ACTN|nr:hypothetical protein [Kineosporia babensis]MCD5310830.1 hypothetical protein [Kineosporia babensis]